MAYSKFDICNQALELVAGGEISSFDDGTRQARVCGRLYEPTVEDLLSEQRWGFAQRQQVLTPSVTKPDARWSNAFVLPAGVIVLHAVTLNGQPVSFDRYVIDGHDCACCDLSDDDQPVADFTWRADEALWPPYFVSKVRYELAELFAAALTSKEDKASYWNQKAAAKSPKSAATDAQSRTARRFRASRLITQR